ncbi:CDP-diacylglycerol--glycerol-3-phosphate 3-phosphatidyltransferase, mitochondrial-like isoform X1 [Zophobas morio]|uniref:CDP-diacylglycerol--glycerol-3-phosphate 3-phosphatidyltransferase, mitochondrial-like isoform X1 n=1 Tax=Zophobas morio TaxID=2755281 RepID=UPI003083AEF6
MKSPGPCIPLSSKKIRFLYQPCQFFETLRKGIQNSKRRITLASLYLGDGPMETILVTDLCNAARRGIKINVLLDFFRGTRGLVNSASLLAPLTAFQKVNVRFFRTPEMSTTLMKLLPFRVNEVIGLQHMKIYSFDDDLLLTGANLSQSYFTARKDRYILFVKHPQLNNFYTELVELVMSISFRLSIARCGFLSTVPGKYFLRAATYYRHGNYTAGLVKWELLPPQGSLGGSSQPGDYKSYVKTVLLTYLDRKSLEHSLESCKDSDSVALPLLQTKALGISQDYEALTTMFSLLSPYSSVVLSTAYFNLPEELQTLLIRSPACTAVVTAAPQANSFHESGGLSSWIPLIYSSLLKGFYQKTLTSCGRVKLYEYFAEKTTFHCKVLQNSAFLLLVNIPAKGFWAELGSGNPIAISFIGSSNYGHRSIHRDLEAQLLMITKNPKLQRSLKKEKKLLFQSTTPVDEKTFSKADRRTFWADLAAPLIYTFL